LDAASVTGGVETSSDVTPPTSPDPDGSTLGALLAGGAAGLVLGSGVAAVALRRRRESAVLAG
jgi:hypothetical protein